MTDGEVGAATTMSLAQRRRLFRRRRHLLTLRDWIGVAGIGAVGLLLALVAILSFLAR